MFIKNLLISKGQNGVIIRDLTFKKGLNLIIDSTPVDALKTSTGNDVGKTTVLKLIDICLGASPAIVYKSEDKSAVKNTTVEEFVIDNNVQVTMTLVADLDDDQSEMITIERNFLSKKGGVVRRINGENFSTDDRFIDKLKELIFPQLVEKRPTFRQVVSRVTRYKDESISKVLETFKNAKGVDLEALNLFFFGFSNMGNYEKGKIESSVKALETRYDNVSNGMELSVYKDFLVACNADIGDLNKKKDALRVNPNFDKDFQEYNRIRAKINELSQTVSSLTLRKKLICKAHDDLQKQSSDVDFAQLKYLYSTVKFFNQQLQKQFEDLTSYHNQMISEKIRFITKELPEIEEALKSSQRVLATYLEQEKKYAAIIKKGDAYAEMEKIIADLELKNQEKGKLDDIISKLESTNGDIEEAHQKLKAISKKLYSKEFESKLELAKSEFNQYFMDASRRFYKENFILSFAREGKNKNYQFKINESTTSSGKVQGKILCYDIAYIQFADARDIPCFHFFLNDRKELLHDNQLTTCADYIKDKNMQAIVSILKDKLPEDVNESNSHIVVELSQTDKLFQIEQS